MTGSFTAHKTQSVVSSQQSAVSMGIPGLLHLIIPVLVVGGARSAEIGAGAGAQCFTLETRSPCVLPFEHNGTVSSTCMTLGEPLGRPRCPTSAPPASWEHCAPGCPLPRCSTDLANSTPYTAQGLPQWLDSAGKGLRPDIQVGIVGRGASDPWSQGVWGHEPAAGQGHLPAVRGGASQGRREHGGGRPQGHPWRLLLVSSLPSYHDDSSMTTSGAR